MFKFKSYMNVILNENKLIANFHRLYTIKHDITEKCRAFYIEYYFLRFIYFVGSFVKKVIFNPRCFSAFPHRNINYEILSLVGKRTSLASWSSHCMSTFLMA